MRKYFRHTQSVPGSAPGIEHHEITGIPGGTGKVYISCMDYSPGQVSINTIDNIEEFVNVHRPEWTNVRWISIEGLSDMHIIQTLATKYNLHPLALEDMLQQTQRPKVEAYGGEDSEFMSRLFIVAHSLQISDGHLHNEQVSIFLGHNTVMTFQENRSAELELLRQRIKVKGTRIRNSDASFLAYSLLDAIIDNCFPILETCSNRAEELETLILEHPRPDVITEIHQLKRDLLLLRWVVWPMREVVSYLQRESHECVSDVTRIYLRDLYDHVIQIIDLIETYREIASDLTETHISAVSNRMNEIMKVLTLIGTIFIPLTFLAGVYGMNFRYFPELNKVWAYPAFWLICIITAVIMLLFFRRRKWL
jgi:magnesium transporter